MENLVMASLSNNDSSPEKRVNWQLKQSLVDIKKGETDYTYEFYFAEQEILAKVTFQKEGRFFVYDSQLDTRVPRHLKMEIIGRTNWTDEITTRQLMRSIIAWEEQRTVDSASLKDHWINYRQFRISPDHLYGGFRFDINFFEAQLAINTMAETKRAERLQLIQPKITYFP